MGDVLIKRKSKPTKCKNNLSVIFDTLKFGNKIVSVELCPNRALNSKVLKTLSPAFCSIMWPSQSDVALKETSKIAAVVLAKRLSLHGNPVLLHLAGRHLTKLQVRNILKELLQIGVRNIFVLQGEPSAENRDKSDFKHASDLVMFIRDEFNNHFCLGVAAYPESHPSSCSKIEDLQYLKMKINAGADFIVTQMIFDIEALCKFLKECKEVGIAVPIIAGVPVFSSYEGLMHMVSFCKVQIPQEIMNVLRNNRGNPEAMRNYGIFQCSQLVKRLLLIRDPQLVGVHFFSLNNLHLVHKICKILGLRDVEINRPIAAN